MPKLPGAAGAIAEDHPDVWKAYQALGEASANAGPLSDREKRLVKLALAVGAGSEGAVHSHARRGLAEGLTKDDMIQVAMLAIGTLGFPQAVAAKTWIEDLG
ncbi:MAG: carboxymuconolactone decarboxylase family protein [Rhizobiales bacterium]|nr:carboxymuconolactone decarboxylase family protein [Hyphomicrobiales bacterium]MBO6699953.1 carboxymuconolactone decarboxylase family protein [Hyphomicrobiales bacterium]MBO6737881.1 carboxymuconolactone decarboxylase family protein [Hyphomicrobiales bacterium]MBO6913061.1 carboxymuconolactone decarboxylase family protein [Hyphomicrobiales bacterium]MBO6956650.1 carboxymuconolactone decarboxylase family protein [Hyphomicrobiales bacterium]